MKLPSNPKEEGQCPKVGAMDLCRGIFVYNICVTSIGNSVSDGATNKSVLNIESS